MLELMLLNVQLAQIANMSYSQQSNFPTPPLVMLIAIAFAGYHILKRQEAARDRAKVLDKKAAKEAKAASSSKALSSKDVRSGGLPSSSAVGNPAPRQVSGKGGDPKKDPSSTSFRKNYFLTMQGPGRPALVPFQDGLRPKKGEAEGTMWWDNIPEGRVRLGLADRRRQRFDGSSARRRQTQGNDEESLERGNAQEGHRVAEIDQAAQGGAGAL